MIAALGCEALERAYTAAVTADIIAAISLEVLKGTRIAFSEEIHKTRPHKGQLLVARRLRECLNYEKYPSQISKSHENCGKVQDSYTLRCIPQVHGVTFDTMDFVRGILNTEINSATDNPMVFAKLNKILSGGNFHGEYPAMALDFLAIGIHEISNISERRIERMTNPALSELPAFLVKDGGLNSGFMMAHVTAAALVSENKTLCHPACIDSIPTSASKEDHVSMGGWAARKVLQVVSNVENVLAIELLSACQGLDLLRPLKSTAPLEAVYNLVRTKIATWDKDRYMKPDIDASCELIRSGQILDAIKPFFDPHMRV